MIVWWIHCSVFNLNQPGFVMMKSGKFDIEMQEWNFKKPLPGTEQSKLLSRKISELSLAIPGTRLEALILQLYQELENAGISFRPKAYLSDEWGYPQGVPVIGIPFYLADPLIPSQAGDSSSSDSQDPTKRNTSPVPSASGLSIASQAGTRRSTRMRILLKPLLSGWRLPRLAGALRGYPCAGQAVIC
jgi:hypothetical protein